MTVSLKVNGKTREVPAEPDTPLLYVLRNDLELNGAKFGCGLSQCGACTVLVDGEAMRSCVTPIGTLGQSEITTHRRPRHASTSPHPLQQAFIDEQAAQCGYCINGMIMTAKALLDRNAAPEAKRDVRAELAGNLCRCGTHDRIIRAVLARRRSEREDLIMNAPMLNRRDFAAGPRRHRRAPSASRPTWRAQQPAKLPGSLQHQPHARCLASYQCRRHRDGVHRQGRTRAGHPDRAGADRGGGARSAATSASTIISGDTGRTPDEGHTSGSSSIENSGTALRMAGAEVRAIAARPRGARSFDVERRHAQGGGRRHHRADGRKVTYGSSRARSI